MSRKKSIAAKKNKHNIEKKNRTKKSTKDHEDEKDAFK